MLPRGAHELQEEEEVVDQSAPGVMGCHESLIQHNIARTQRIPLANCPLEPMMLMIRAAASNETAGLCL